MCSGSTDGTSAVWDSRSGDLLTTLIQPSGAGVRVVTFSGTGLLATAGDDEVICVWYISSGQLIKTITGHEASIFAVVFSPDSEIIVSSDAMGRVKVWSSVLSHSTKLTGVEEAHDLGVTSLVFIPEIIKSSVSSCEYRLVSCGNDGDIAVWSILTGADNRLELVRRVSGHEGAAMSVAVSGDMILASAGGDKLVKLWSQNLDLLQELSAHSRYVTCISFSPCGRYLASGSNDKSIKVWCLNQKHHPSSESRGSNDEYINRRLCHTKQIVHQQLSVTGGDVTSCDLAGDLLAVGCTDSSVRVWRYCSETGQFGSGEVVSGGSSSVYSVMFSGAGTRLVSASLGGRVMVWSVPHLEITHTWTHPQASALRVVRFNAAADVVGVGGDDDMVHLWSLDSDHVETISWHDNTTQALAFDTVSGQEMVAVGCSGGSLSLWSVSPVCLVTSVHDAHDLGVTGLVFTMDHSLLSVGQDGELKVWSLSDEKLLCKHRIRAHPTTVMCVWTNSSRELLITTSGDKTSKVWMLDTVAGVTCAATFGPEESYVTCGAAAIVNNNTVVAVGVNNNIILYSLPSDQNTSSNQNFDISNWSNSDVREWLNFLKFDLDTLQAVTDSNIDGADLKSYKAVDLVRLGLDNDVSENICDEVKLLLDVDKFLCPITCDMMSAPVQCSDGFIYEETAIKVQTIDFKLAECVTY